MAKRLLVAFILLFFLSRTHAQIGAMKLVGPNTQDYAFGFGAFIKTGIPTSEATFITLEIAANIFPQKGSGFEYGTLMCPLKAGYRYMLNQTSEGFYVEPQAGYNLVGVTSLPNPYGEPINLHYHGLVLAAGTGYLFSIGGTPFDVGLRYETVIANGGSNNLISLGLSRFFSFGNRNSN